MGVLNASFFEQASCLIGKSSSVTLEVGGSNPGKEDNFSMKIKKKGFFFGI